MTVLESFHQGFSPRVALIAARRGAVLRSRLFNAIGRLGVSPHRQSD